MMKTLIATFVAMLAAPMFLQAQTLQLKVGDVEVDGMEVEVQKTPDFEASGVKDKDVPNPRDWLELEIKFKIDGRDVVVPELLFRYYIGFRDQAGQPRVLTGDVKHKNMVAGEDYYSAVYVAPSTLGEITGDFRRFQDNQVQAYGVEIYYNGVIVGGESSQGGQFWQSTGTSPGVLPKDKTPFALLWIDRYPETETN